LDGTGTPVADIGSWAVAHPPATAFVLKGGVQYALEPYRGGFSRRNAYVVTLTGKVMKISGIH
jgi:hypothetical protein